MAKLVGADRKTTVTQVTSVYNHDVQKSISECITYQTLRQMGYDSNRPHALVFYPRTGIYRKLQ